MYARREDKVKTFSRKPFYPSSLTFGIKESTTFFQMPSVVQQQRMEVEQLRREAAMKRIPVSQAVEDIKVSKVNVVRHVSFNCRQEGVVADQKEHCGGLS